MEFTEAESNMNVKREAEGGGKVQGRDVETLCVFASTALQAAGRSGQDTQATVPLPTPQSSPLLLGWGVLRPLLSSPELQDLVSEYQQYQDATAEEEGEFDEEEGEYDMDPN